MFSITTDCTLDSLGANVSSDSSECGEGEMAADIPNGMLCYTGLTPGSTSTYSCDNGSNGVLECKPNGAWNRTILDCLCKQHVRMYVCMYLSTLYLPFTCMLLKCTCVGSGLIF